MFSIKAIHRTTNRVPLRFLLAVLLRALFTRQVRTLPAIRFVFLESLASLGEVNEVLLGKHLLGISKLESALLNILEETLLELSWQTALRKRSIRVFDSSVL